MLRWITRLEARKLKMHGALANDSEADPKKAYVSDYARESYWEDFGR